MTCGVWIDSPQYVKIKEKKRKAGKGGGNWGDQNFAKSVKTPLTEIYWLQKIFLLPLLPLLLVISCMCIYVCVYIYCKV